MQQDAKASQRVIGRECIVEAMRRPTEKVNSEELKSVKW